MLISSLAALAMGQALTDPVRLMRWPDVHGDKIAFVYASDIWVADLKGGAARRLTSHPGLESLPKFSPDGKTIAFTGQYDGANNVYTIPVDGGVPKRLTFEPANESVEGWTPDGKKVAFSSNYGNHTNRMARLWFVDAKGGNPERTDISEVADLSFSPDGSMMAYNRAQSHQFNWRRYRGGTQGRISFWDFKTGSYSEIPADREQNYFPMWVGEDVYFLSDRNLANINLYKYNTKSKKVSQVTNYTDGDMRWPSTDGKTLVFERKLRLWSMDLASGQVTALDPHVSGDNLSMRPRYVNLGNQVSNFALSPTGKRLAVEARGDVFSVPATSGETRNLSDSDGVREQNPVWSPDGQHIYYLTDRSGNVQLARRAQMGGPEESIPIPAGVVPSRFDISPDGKHIALYGIDFSLYTINLETKQSKLVIRDMGGPVNADWSFDGQYLAYTKTLPNLLSAVCIYDLANGMEHEVNRGMFADTSPTFDLTGKYLYFISARDYAPNNGVLGPTLEQTGDIQRVYMTTLHKGDPNPLLPTGDEEPVKGGEEGSNPETGKGIDFAGIESRTISLPYPVGSYQGLVGLKNGVMVFAGNAATSFSLVSKSIAPIMPQLQGATFNYDRTKMAYSLGSTIGIVDVRPGNKPGDGAVALNRVGRVIDPAKEYKQMFWNAWRYERDNFYDEGMLGLDWKAIGDKYAALLPDIGDRSDFDYILGQLIGELGTGHSYITPGAGGSDPMTPPCGLLGADYQAVGNKIKITKVYRGVDYLPDVRGPLGAIGVDVNDGDFLLAIDGEAVTPAKSITEMLMGKVGRGVEITVNSSPSMEGARKYTVYPTVSETNLRYESWVEERRAFVDKMSGGKIGYMHVPDTNVQGMILFLRGYLSQFDKEAWVIDERYNGGGWIPTFYINYLSAHFTNVIAPRYGANTGLEPSLNGPKAMLINQHAGSGGDLFPYLFKKAGIGPLIGKRTWGGLVGIQGTYPLVGGGGLTAPAFGIFDPDTGKWIAENKGVDPDIDIDDRPDLAAKGQDPQLAKAVEVLQGQIKGGPKPLTRPPFPKVGGN